MKRTLIVIPAFNEAQSLPQLIGAVRQHVPMPTSSSWTTRRPKRRRVASAAWRAMDSSVAAPRHRIRGANRTSVGGPHTGTRSSSASTATGSTPPEHIHRLLEPLLCGSADVVIGSRYVGKEPVDTPRLRRFLHLLLGEVLTLITQRLVTDPTSGFWAFGENALHLLVDHHPSGYPEPELLLFLSRNGLRVIEVSVQMRTRITGRTSLTPQRTWSAIARLLLHLRRRPAAVHRGSQP
jgi:hypothetical protein